MFPKNQKDVVNGNFEKARWIVVAEGVEKVFCFFHCAHIF